jgi:hypothetical protein
MQAWLPVGCSIFEQMRFTARYSDILTLLYQLESLSGVFFMNVAGALV